MEQNMVKDESLLEVNGGKWTIDTLTEEEREEYYKVAEGLREEYNYVAYNDFIRRMNEKYGSNY